MRPDFRLPFSVKDVGPSAPAFFQGGDICFCLPMEGGGVDSRVRRRLEGRSSSLSEEMGAGWSGAGDGDGDDGDDDADDDAGEGGPSPMKSKPFGVSWSLKSSEPKDSSGEEGGSGSS